MTRLDRLLRTLHAQGYWIEAWYPLTTRDEFECRITAGAGLAGWATNPDALEALAGAMRTAGLPVEPVAAADSPEAYAKRWYDQLGGGHD